MGNVPSGCDGYSTWAVLLNTFPDTFLSIVPLVPLVQPLICISYVQAILMYMYMCSCTFIHVIVRTLQIFIHLQYISIHR